MYFLTYHPLPHTSQMAAVCDTLIKARGEVLTALLRNEKMALPPAAATEQLISSEGVGGGGSLLIGLLSVPFS